MTFVDVFYFKMLHSNVLKFSKGVTGVAHEHPEVECWTDNQEYSNNVYLNRKNLSLSSVSHCAQSVPSYLNTQNK